MLEISEWVKENEIEGSLIYKEAALEQILFIVSNIKNIFLSNERGFGFDSEKRCYPDLRIYVISTHTSKSVLLPVYYFEWHEIKFILRNNFHDWKVSIDSEIPLEIDFEDIFEDVDNSSCYFEGFPADTVYGSFSKSNKKFSVEIYNKNKLFFFLRKIMYYMRVLEAKEYPFYELVEQMLKELPKEILKIDYYCKNTFKDWVKTYVLKKETKILHDWGKLHSILERTFYDDYTKKLKVPKDVAIKAYMTTFKKLPEWLEDEE